MAERENGMVSDFLPKRLVNVTEVLQTCRPNSGDLLSFLDDLGRWHRGKAEPAGKKSRLAMEPPSTVRPRPLFG